MYVRCAFFEGEVEAANRDRFEKQFSSTIVPLLRQLPGLIELRILRPELREPGAPPIHLQAEMVFASRAELEQALQSDVAPRIKAKAAEIMPLFSGRVYHVNYAAEQHAAGPQPGA